MESPPYRGEVRRQDKMRLAFAARTATSSPLPGGGAAARQNEVGLAARTAASSRAPAPAPPSLHCDHDALHVKNCAKKVPRLVTRAQEGEFYDDEIEVQ